MENVQLGFQAILLLLKTEVSVLYYSPVIRGFAFGYVVASLMYGFIITKELRKKKN